MWRKKEELERKTNHITNKPLSLQVWLNYHNQNFYIKRTVKSLTFKINNEDCTQSKKETQQKIEDCLPFVKYWRYFFIKANCHYFENIDKTELMSVLFNLKIFDFIEAQAKTLQKESSRKLRENEDHRIEISTKLSTKSEELEQAKQQILLLPQNHVDLAEVEKSINTIKDMLALYQKHQNSYAVAEQELKQAEQYIDTHKGNEHINYSIVNNNISEIKQKIATAEKTNSKIDELNREKIYFDSRLSTLKRVEIKKCPHCGGILQGQNQNEINKATEEIARLDSELNRYQRVEINQLYKDLQENQYQLSQYNEYSLKKDFIKLTTQKLLQAKNYLTNEETKIKKELAQYNCTDINELCAYYYKVKSEVQSYHTALQQISSLESTINKLKDEMVSTEAQINELKDKIEKIAHYIELFDLENIKSIPYAILKKLVTYLNTDNICFKAATDEGKFNISVAIKIGNNWIDYDDCSDGQKNYLDIFILIRISAFLNGIGLLIMDEPIANMDTQYLDAACRLLPEIHSNTILISSHSRLEGFDRIISVRQDSLGLTKISF